MTTVIARTKAFVLLYRPLYQNKYAIRHEPARNMTCQGFEYSTMIKEAGKKRCYCDVAFPKKLLFLFHSLSSQI